MPWSGGTNPRCFGILEAVPLLQGAAAALQALQRAFRSPHLQRAVGEPENRKEGQEYTDAVGRLTETVNRRLPQLRYAPAERAGVRRAARWPWDGTARSRASSAGCSKAKMEERRQFGFRVRPNYGQVLGYIAATST